MAVFLSGSAEATEQFAQKFASSLRGGDVVLLEGEMGAGKTVFVKGLAKGLGIDDEVLSPTYAYMNEYGGGRLYHYDCYRLSCGAQAEALGLTEYFSGDGICVLEWAQNIAEVLPDDCIKVTIGKLGKVNRVIRVG